MAILGAATAATAYVAFVDPNEPGHYPTCPFLALTGYYCAGCGALRTVHALAHGQLGAAIGYNALLVTVILPMFAWLWLRWTERLLRRKPPAPLASPALVWGLTALILVFWGARNLPFASALAP